MKRKMKTFFGILLSLALVMGLMPGMSLTAYATSQQHVVIITTDSDPSYSYLGSTTIDENTTLPKDYTIQQLVGENLVDWANYTATSVTVNGDNAVKGSGTGNF